MVGLTKLNKRDSEMKKILLMGLLSSVVLLSGCAAGMFGGGHHSNNSSATEQRSIQQVKADGAISSRVKAHFANNAVLKSLNVSTYRGVVTLHGTVPSHDVMARAIRLAESVQGVASVRSGMRLR